jgi:hypothetical protein
MVYMDKCSVKIATSYPKGCLKNYTEEGNTLTKVIKAKLVLFWGPESSAEHTIQPSKSTFVLFTSFLLLYFIIIRSLRA